jgi:hypothetical protein
MRRDDVPAGDRVAASLRVDVPQAEAFRVFVEEIDLWWRHGVKFRAGGRGRSVLHLEPRLGGRLFETLRSGNDDDRGDDRDEAGDVAPAHVAQTGEIVEWSPPAGFVLRWRALNFRPGEATRVEVRFEPQGDASTLVSVVHTGWAALPPDHPVRHGEPVPAFIARTATWWGDLLSGLRRHLAERAAR